MEKSFLSSFEFTQNLLSHPHGRRMVAAIVALNPGEAEMMVSALAEMPREYQREMRPLLKGFPWSPELVGDAIHAGIVDNISPGDDAFSSFIKLVTSQTSFAVPGSLDAIDLANPALSPETVQSLWRLAKGAPIKRMLSVNPNATKDMRVPAPAPANEALITAAARFGDLAAPFISEILNKNIFSDKSECSPELQNNLIGTLCLRDDLTPEFIASLSEAADGKAYWDLTRNPFNRAACPALLPQKDMVPSRYFGHSALKLHPEIELPTLQAIMKSLETIPGKVHQKNWQTEMARLAGHPNSDDALIDRYFANTKEAIPGKYIPSGSPAFLERAWKGLIERGLMAIDGVATIEDCSATTLAWAYREIGDTKSGILRLLTHKNFPWGEFAGEDAGTKVSPANRPAVRVSRFLRGSPSQAEISYAIEGESARELLFSQTLSSSRLTKIVELHPELATLAAIHPNADGIAFPAEHADIVTRCRPQRFEVLLAGKGRVGNSAEPAHRLEV